MNSMEKITENDAAESNEKTRRDIQELQGIISKYIEKCSYAAVDDAADESEDSFQEKVMKGLMKLAKARLGVKSSYLNLGSLFIFCIFYAVALLLQRDIESSYGIETRYIMKWCRERAEDHSCLLLISNFSPSCLSVQ